MVKEIHSPSSKPVAKFLSSLAIGFVVLTASAHPSSAQTFSRSFAVSPERSEVEVVNQTGTIKVTAGANSAKIVINAKHSDGAAKIDATQNAMGKVKIEVTGKGSVDFEITVPASSSIDLLSYRGAIVVTNLAGAVRARVTDGDIQIAGMRSARVEAHCTRGNVSFSGEILPSGSYTLKSFSGRVDATLPADADFKLTASSFRGGMDLDAFPMKFDKRTHQLVEASRGSGRASIRLWTQEGSIHLHRKP
jgi:Putative adhesin